MAKQLFTADFEINASKKMLYPYISSASGLSQWFCDDVNINEDKEYNFIWDGDDHQAKMISHKTNNYVRFEFIDDVDNGEPSYFELKIETNELTQSTFIKITDYAEFEDAQEQYDLWESLVQSLKEIVGG